MHSIFQLSAKPISEGDFLSPEHLYDRCNDFADYIGDKYEGEKRTDKIKGIAAEFPNIFDIDGEVLIYKGLGNFLKEWVEKIQEIAKDLTEENILKDANLYRMKCITERTHLDTYSRFYVEEWNNYAGDCADFICWLSTLEVGTRIYVGSVINYHF